MVRLHSKALLSIIIVFSLSAELPDFQEKRYFTREEYGFKTELKLGQGRVGKIAGEMWDVYVPTNRPTWAISYAHGYQLLRNMFKMELFPMEAFIGIIMQESQMGCDHDAKWDSSLKNPPRKLWNNQDGFYQIRSDLSSGWGEMSNTIFPDRFDFSSFDQVVGTSHLETATIAAVYYIAVTLYQWKYIDGYKPFELFDNSVDKDGFIKLLSSQYYMGYDDQYGVAKLLFETKRTEAYTASDYMAFYDEFSESVVQEMKEHGSHVNQVVHILQDRADEISDTVDCKFGGYYDELISWEIVEEYINKILVLYPEIDKTEYTDKIKSKFNSINSGNSLSFRFDFAPVLDEIVINLPIDNGVKKFADYLGHNKWDNSLEYTPKFNKGATGISGLQRAVKTSPVKVTADAVNFMNSRDGNVSLSIFTLNGRAIGKISNRWVNKGSHSIALDEFDLTPGCYVIKLNTPDHNTSIRYIK